MPGPLTNLPYSKMGVHLAPISLRGADTLPQRFHMEGTSPQSYMAHLIAWQHAVDFAGTLSEDGRCAVDGQLPVIAASQVLSQHALCCLLTTLSWLGIHLCDQEGLVPAVQESLWHCSAANALDIPVTVERAQHVQAHSV